jgi:hypothetical protein
MKKVTNRKLLTESNATIYDRYESIRCSLCIFDTQSLCWYTFYMLSAIKAIPSNQINI